MSKVKSAGYKSVWDALAETPEEAANLRVRSELMREIAAELARVMQENQWTQADAARSCGVTQPRINDLLRGRISRFSIDGLVNIAGALGLRVNLALDAADAPATSERRRQARRAREPKRPARSGAGRTSAGGHAGRVLTRST